MALCWRLAVAYLCAVSCPLAVCAPVKVLDMTHRIDEHVQFWARQQRPTLQDVASVVGLNGTWVANNLLTGEHVGTHMDAPTHRILHKNQWSVDEIPVEKLFGPAVRIDVRNQVQASLARGIRDYPISVEDIVNHEKEHGNISEGAIVFSCTGWAEKYGVSVEDYWGVNSTELGSGWSFPGFGLDAAKWLMKNRKIIGLGSDTPSCEPGDTHEFPVHVAMFSQNVWCLEHVDKTCELKPSGATAYAFPIKMKGGSGTTIRVVATWPRDGDKDPNRTKKDPGSNNTDNSASALLGLSPVHMMIFTLCFEILRLI